MLDAIQTWLADRGHGQYPLQRRGPPVDHPIMRLAIGFLGLFWGAVFAVALIVILYVLGIFVWAALTTPSS